MSKRKVQPVSFNLSDVFESNLYKFAMSNGKFSKYIKRLIQRDKEGSMVPVRIELVEEPKKKAVISSFL
jgi:hypothetical protein